MKRLGTCYEIIKFIEKKSFKLVKMSKDPKKLESIIKIINYNV